MSDETLALDNDQAAFVIWQVGMWLDLRMTNGYGERYPANSAEAHHSGLLYRLLRGVKPLPEPPEDSRRAAPEAWPEPTWVRRKS